ncbi:response regulator transcription factor [Gilvimarinus sp. DA14]|uniref:response regulator transcription factor n=1 Tax=Gilvimarinus sp. DA14 TaxID=2956798 RepID=UPI0020B65A3F|nr:response regulator transcription factor [Gilvimarinus sp. DA14]UTF59014.1 response regulator transcription factor [Gilvimarinus sp. DA14]
MTINVLVVDDQTLVREGIKSLLSLNSDIHVCGEAWDGQQALDMLQSMSPNVVLLDIRMPVMGGLELLQALEKESISFNILVLTTFDEHDLVLECLRLGAKGYLKKDVSLNTLVNAIKTVAEGKNWMQPVVTERIKNQVLPVGERHKVMASPLTEKEQQILQLVAAGYTNNEIAGAIFRSEGTVRNQVSSILSKLEVKDRTRAVLKAMDLGIL